MTEYEKFVDKFKTKLTTDDCYTPKPVFDAVLEWAVSEYDLGGCNIIMPFYPNGDFENHEYPENGVVIDNPPFSIITKIARFYSDRGIRYFLFAPHLTMFNLHKADRDLCAIVCGASVTYENGAVVSTSFVTNLEPQTFARTAPELKLAIEDAGSIDRVSKPKYVYPKTVTSAALMSKLSRVDVSIPKHEARLVTRLESQKEAKKTIFGGGAIVSEAVAEQLARAANTIEWELAEHEVVA